jgi:hypothetical protein
MLPVLTDAQYTDRGFFIESSDFIPFSFSGGYTPSFDFELFDLSSFSPLQANEFGAETSFRANTPTRYADFSLDQLLGMTRTPNEIPFLTRNYQDDFELLNMLRFFQSGTGDLPGSRAQIEAEVEKTKKVYEQAKDEYSKIKQIGDAIRGAGKGVYDVATAPTELPGRAAEATNEVAKSAMKPLSDNLKTFVQTYAIAIIAFVALIFLFLFVRK